MDKESVKEKEFLDLVDRCWVLITKRRKSEKTLTVSLVNLEVFFWDMEDLRRRESGEAQRDIMCFFWNLFS